MKRPSFQFYPADWSSNPNLKRCSFAEKGIWLEVMCLMHDQAEYGVLRWPLKEIAEAVKCKPADLQALHRKGVRKGSDTALDEAYIYVPRSGRKDGAPVTLVDTQAGPIWYSSRMVKDEYIRTIRGDSGGNGETPKQPPKQSPGSPPKPPIGEAFGPRDAGTPAAPSSSSSSSSSSAEKTGAEVFPLTGEGEPPVVEGFEPSAAALVTRRLREAGIGRANPTSQRLIALVEAGATAEEFLAFADKALEMSDPFAYLLGCVEGERKRAKRNGAEMHRGRLPSKQEAIEQRNRAVADEWLAQQGST